jgi:RHS repeat-associated protein
MNRRSLRGVMLRGISMSAITAVILATPAISAQATAVAEPETALATPAAAWTPPSHVNRTPVGSVPPATPWHGAGSSGHAESPDTLRAAAVTCASGVATGIMKQYPLERFPISDRSQLLVNTSNGNVVINAADLTVQGTGQNLSINHVYNSRLPGGGALGAGWSLNTGQDVGLTFEGANVVLHGESAYCATYVKNPDGSYKPAPGVAAEFKREADGTYTLTYNGSNEKWTFTAQGWLTKQADRNGNATTLNYNASGALTSITDSQGRVTTFAYNSAGRLESITDPTGTVAAAYTYDTTGKLLTSTDRDGKLTSLQYDAAGNLSVLKDAKSATTKLTYDTSDRVIKVMIPGRSTTSNTLFVYGDKQTTETDANNHNIVYTYDDQGRQLKATDALGHIQSRTWTANSDVEISTDGLTNNTTQKYDTLNNNIGTKLPTGAETAVGYTKTGQPHLPTSAKDPQGNELTRDYDAAGNLTKVRSTGLGVDVQVNTYNTPKGTLATSKDGNGHTTAFGYDSVGNLTTVTPPAPAGAQTYTYDSLSRVASVTDGNSVRIDYVYDKLDRVVAISKAGQTVQANTYDALGNLTDRAVPGSHTGFQWAKTSAASQVISSQRFQGTAVENVAYTYDAVGNLTKLADAAGSSTYTYDAANRLVSLLDPFGQTTTFGYDNADRRTNTTFPGAGTQTNGYDNSGRQTSLTVANTAGTELLKATYSYTTGAGADSDKMQSKTTGGVTTAYTYDTYRRLTKAATATFAHDPANNLTNQNGTAYTVNNANQFTKVGTDSISFDGAGNLTGQTSNNSSFTYSSTNQLLTGSSNGQQLLTASYDTADQTQRRTVTEKIGTTTFSYTFGQTALGTLQVVGNGARTSYSRDTNGTLITEKAASGARYNLITDYQGSVLALLDTAGNVAANYSYSPFGATTVTGAAADANFFRWLGTYQLRGGVYLTGYRYYNSTFGRFTQTDPTQQEANNYAYATGDPINNSDPSGASTASSQGATVGGFLGGLAGVALVAACPITAGAGCLAAGAVIGGMTGGAGAALGSKLAGGTTQEVNDDGLAGITAGTLPSAWKGAKMLTKSIFG